MNHMLNNANISMRRPSADDDLTMNNAKQEGDSVG